MKCADPGAARSKTSVCGRSLAKIAVSNPSVCMDVCLFVVDTVCCRVEVFVTGRSLVERTSAECGVRDCV
jgi:hypothetical protein